MILNLTNPEHVRSLTQKFREKRFAFFLGLLNNIKATAPIKILDIGGTEAYWEKMGFTNRSDVHITLLNLKAIPTKHANFISVAGDASNLSEYGDKEFDVAHSNSVIEHLFTKENQIKMADEVRRVGKNYWVQTPNYYFPLEPHWRFPFFQFLPREVRINLTQHLDLGSNPKKKTREAAKRKVDEVRLLTPKEMRTLFPEGKTYKEIVMGLTKSITMYHFPDTDSKRETGD